MRDDGEPWGGTMCASPRPGTRGHAPLYKTYTVTPSSDTTPNTGANTSMKALSRGEFDAAARSDTKLNP